MDARTEKRAARFARRFAWFDGLSADLLFWVAVDTLFYTYVKHQTPAEIVGAATVSMIVSAVLTLPGMLVIRKIGNTASLRVGAVFVLASALTFTFASGFYGMLAARIFYEIGFIFHTMTAVVLKNDLHALGKDESYLSLRARGTSVYAALTMAISFAAGPLFNVNPYIPMGACIFFALLVCYMAFTSFDVTDGTPAAEPPKEREKSPLRSPGAVPVLSLVGFTVFFPVVNLGQSDGKLFIQEFLSDTLGEESRERVVLLISAMLIVSRIVRMLANLVFEKLASVAKDRIGVYLSCLLFLAFGWILLGYFLPLPLWAKYALMVYGYVHLLFARDPYKVYVETLAVETVASSALPSFLSWMNFTRKIFRSAAGLLFTALLLHYPLLWEIWILLGLSALEIALSFALYFAVMRRKAASPSI